MKMFVNFGYLLHFCCAVQTVDLPQLCSPLSADQSAFQFYSGGILAGTLAEVSTILFWQSAMTHQQPVLVGEEFQRSKLG